MRIKIISGTEPEIETKGKEIFDEYNKAFSYKEKFEFNNLSTLKIYCVEGVRGGVLTDCTFGEYPHIRMINMVAFEEKHRGKGCLTACLEAMSEDTASEDKIIGGVYLNPQDPAKLWHKFGLLHDGMINFTKVLCSQPQDQLFDKHECHKDGIPIDEDFFRILEQQLAGKKL